MDKRYLKIICLMALLTAAVLLLSSCRKEEEGKESGEEIEDGLNPLALGDTREVEDLPAIVDEDVEEEPEEEEQLPLSDAEFLARAWDENDIENNGGTFVRVGSRVYFIRYEREAYPEANEDGIFTDERAEDAEGYISYYDINSGEHFESSVPVFASGGLYACREGFYIIDPVDNEGRYSLFSPDGANEKLLTADNQPELSEPEKSEGSVKLSEGEYGNLMYVYPDGTERKLVTEFRGAPGSDASKEGFGQSVIQESCVMDCGLFLVVADCEEPAGGYELLNLKYEYFPFDTGDSAEMGEAQSILLADTY